jgi:hypothetical protein
MKDYEIVSTYLNGCAGSAHPITTFEEATLHCPEDYLKEKHGEQFHQFTKEIRPNGQVVFTYQNVVTYIYEFTELS